MPSTDRADLEEILQDFHNQAAMPAKCNDLEVAALRYLRGGQSAVVWSLIAKEDIPAGTELSCYVGTAHSAQLDPHSNHSMYLGPCGGIFLNANATRLPGDLQLGACMHFFRP